MVLATVCIVIVSLVIVPLLMRLYCRLTVGKCHSQQDMTGKTVLITGASSGIGRTTAMDLARRNARVLMACRNLEKAEKVKTEIVCTTGNTNVEVVHLELQSFKSVRKCAEDVLRTENRLDVLINNAGVLYYDGSKTEDGCEATMQTNHLGHFLLTLLLLDILKNSRPSRIINVSSTAYIIAALGGSIEDINSIKLKNIWKRLGYLYCRTKLANILFTKELARRLHGTGVTVNALHPGVIHTDFLYKSEHPVLSWYRLFLYLTGKSDEEGAQTSIYLAVHPDLENTTGKFFADCQESMLIGKAKNKAMAQKLFEISEQLVGETCKDCSN